MVVNKNMTSINKLKLKINNLSKKRKILYIILGVILFIFIKSTFVFAGPIFGQLIDAKTGKPISNIKINLKIEACLGAELLNVGGCNSDTIYNKTIVSDKNGKFIFPFKIIFKNPIGIISKRQFSVNEIDINNLVYSGELHSPYYGKGPYSFISGGVAGYEELDYEIKWIPFSKRKIYLVPLAEFMTADDCSKNMAEIDRRRCFDHVAIREAQPLVAIVEKNGGTWQTLRIQEEIYRYYRTKYFGDCNKPQNYGNGIPTESNCLKILNVIKENDSICSVIIEPNDFIYDNIPDISGLIKSECELYDVGSLTKDGKNPLVPKIIKDINFCNQYQGNLLELCHKNYEFLDYYLDSLSKRYYTKHI